MNEFYGYEDNLTSDKHIFEILKHKYCYEIDYDGKEGNKNISIFLNWIWLFDALSDLATLADKNLRPVEKDFNKSSPNYPKLCDLFNKLNVGREIFSYKHKIKFELFHIFECSLKIYDQKHKGINNYGFLSALENYSLTGINFPVQQCLSFFAIFSEQLLMQQDISSSPRKIKDKLLLQHQQHIQNLFSRYGSLYVLNVTYRFCSGNADMQHVQDVILKIENQIVLDHRLLKAEFKVEDDGLQGCLLNCILIYPAQAMRNAEGYISQLEMLAENYRNGIQIKFGNWGATLGSISQLEFTEFIENQEKLDNFLYWVAGVFYRHDDFFSYSLKNNRGEEFQHRFVKEAWTLSLNSSSYQISEELKNVNVPEMMEAISDPAKVWSTQVLSKTLQRKLVIDQTILSEIRYDLGFDQKLNRDILYCMQVFYTFCQISVEPFFIFKMRQGVLTQVQPSRLGKQLIFLFNLLCQTPDAFSDIREMNVLLANHFQELLNSQLWRTLMKLEESGSAKILDLQTFLNLNLLLDRLKTGEEFGTYMAGLHSEDTCLSHSMDDLVFFDKRTKDAQDYVEKLLKTDQWICRVKFYAQIKGVSFLDKREIFSTHFTEFLRVNKRRNVLKHMSGYFLIWLNNDFEHDYSFKEINPYVDVVFLIEHEYGFDEKKFKDELLLAWNHFEGKESLLDKGSEVFKVKDLKYEILMHSVDSLATPSVIVRKSDKSMKRLVLEKLLPYFTYRHFYLPKRSKDKSVRSIKMFTKGTLKAKAKKV